MTNTHINAGWHLCILKYGEPSPMEDHGPMELGADDATKRIFAHETLVVFYGTESVLKSCREYIANNV